MRANHYCKKEEQLLEASPRTAHQAVLSHHRPHTFAEEASCLFSSAAHPATPLHLALLVGFAGETLQITHKRLYECHCPLLGLRGRRLRLGDLRLGRRGWLRRRRRDGRLGRGRRGLGGGLVFPGFSCGDRRRLRPPHHPGQNVLPQRLDLQTGLTSRCPQTAAHGQRLLGHVADRPCR